TQINDPVGSGFVASLSRPGGNITGFTPGEFSMYRKYPELLKEIAPSITRAAVMLNLEQSPQVGIWREIEAGAPLVGVQVTAACGLTSRASLPYSIRPSSNSSSTA